MGLQCLPRPVYPKTWDHYGKFSLFPDIETRIMYKLQNTVLQHTSVLIAVLDYTAELDW